jgi:hypothetical protein
MCYHRANISRSAVSGAPPTRLYSWFVFKEDVMGDKSPKNINKQKKDHGKKKEEQKKKPAVSSIKK